MIIFKECFWNLLWVTWCIMNFVFLYVEMPFGRENARVKIPTAFFGFISIPIFIWQSLWLVKTFFQIP